MISLPPYILPSIERTDFDVPDFREAIISKSVRLWWEAASDCPCQMVITATDKTGPTGEGRSNCPGCKGSRILYDDGQQTIGMLLGTREDQERFNEFGSTATGYAYLTLQAENVPAYNDRFTLFDGWRIHTETRQREGTQEALRYPVVRRTFMVGSGPKLTIPKSVTVGVFHCTYTDTSGVLVTYDAGGGRLRPVVLVEGTHFTIVNGMVDWTLGIGLGVVPAIGAWYSMRYFARPVFVVQDHVFLRRDLWNKTERAGVLTFGSHPMAALVLAEHLGIRNPPVVTFFPQPTFAMPG